MIIYLVTVGEYSDYGIHSAWSTQEKAQQAADLLNQCGQGASVEEYPIDSYPNNKVPIPIFRVWIHATSGEEIQCYKGIFDPDNSWTPSTNYYDNNERVILKKIDGIWKFNYKDSPYNLPPSDVHIFAEGETKELALKRAYDLRAQWLAKAEGI